VDPKSQKGRALAQVKPVTEVLDSSLHVLDGNMGYTYLLMLNRANNFD